MACQDSRLQLCGIISMMTGQKEAICQFSPTHDIFSLSRLRCDRPLAAKVIIHQEGLGDLSIKDAFDLVNQTYCRNPDQSEREDCQAHQSLAQEGDTSVFARTTEMESARRRDLLDQAELAGRSLSMVATEIDSFLPIILPIHSADPGSE